MKNGWRRSVLALGGIVMLAVWLVGCSTSTNHSTARPPGATPVPGSITWQRANAPQIDTLARRILATMSLDQKIGQLFLQGFETIGYAPENAAIMQQIQPGGTMWYAFQMPDIATTRATLAATQHASLIPVLTAADNEGGFINNLRNMFPPFPSATSIGKTNDPAQAYADSTLIAKDMLSVGLNTDMAPVVDVQTIPYGADIHDRTYGTTPDQVEHMAGAALQGLQDHGVIGALKHFPGLGAALLDAHFTLPIVYRSRADLESIDLAPYRAMLNTPDAPGLVMSTDVLMPNIDPNLPAEISPIFINGILRGELHYTGVVVTDALYMEGITKPTGTYPGMTMFQAGVMALQAGCDMLNFAFNLRDALTMRTTIENAIQQGQLTVERIDESVLRILRLKIDRGIIPFHFEIPPGAPQVPRLAIGAILAPAKP
jgi:beta-N-acetylhexosaminidase